MYKEENDVWDAWNMGIYKAIQYVRNTKIRQF